MVGPDGVLQGLEPEVPFWCLRNIQVQRLVNNLDYFQDRIGPAKITFKSEIRAVLKA